MDTDLKVTIGTYLVQYTVTPTPDLVAGDKPSWTAVAHGRSFHEGLFAEGATSADAVRALAETVAAALESPTAIKRWGKPGGKSRFTDVYLVPLGVGLHAPIDQLAS